MLASSIEIMFSPALIVLMHFVSLSISQNPNSRLRCDVETTRDIQLHNASDITESTLKLVLDFRRTGNCKKGSVYQIVDGTYLQKNRENLECIFFSGVTPSKVPLGALYGKVYSILHTSQLNSIVEMIWSGKCVKKLQCLSPHNGQQTTVHVGWNGLIAQAAVPFIATVERNIENFAPGEHHDEKDSLIIDYTREFSQICSRIEPSLGIFIPQSGRNLYPLNRIVDVLRVVGRQEDGGLILLGKMYFRDALQGTRTMLYFTCTTYDAGVNPDFIVGQGLPPLSDAFSYSIVGV